MKRSLAKHNVYCSFIFTVIPWKHFACGNFDLLPIHQLFFGGMYSYAKYNVHAIHFSYCNDNTVKVQLRKSLSQRHKNSNFIRFSCLVFRPYLSKIKFCPQYTGYIMLCQRPFYARSPSGLLVSMF